MYDQAKSQVKLENWNYKVVHLVDGQVSVSSPNSELEKLIGKKALGLLGIPQIWTLPFFTISSDFYCKWRTCEETRRAACISKWQDRIDDSFKEIGITPLSPIIVRSSGCDEGIAQRGTFYSHQGIAENISELITKSFVQIEKDEKIRDQKIALIVQAFAQPKARGHLSNERHFYEEKRDWLGEIEIQGTNAGNQFRINFRNWRDQSVGKLIPETLQCHSRPMVVSALKPVAAHYYQTVEPRVHLEWIWEGQQIYIVQADSEDEHIGSNPRSVTTLKAQSQKSRKLVVLKELTDDHANRFSKLKNVYSYRTLGLATVPLFVLDDPYVLREVGRGNISPDLRKDIETLLKAPLVIRTDIEETNHLKKQFLRRSDELRSTEDALEWLIDACSDLDLNVNDSMARALIFHNFVPAVSSAFVYAEPSDRNVQIAGLWGLPEGLYYNSHDQFLVDTQRPELNEAINIPIDQFEITKKRHYKRFFVYPDDSGRFTRKVVAPPNDWRSSIWMDYWLRKMAIDSRRIAALEGRALSIMWFVGVGGSQSKRAIMPWFHETFDKRLLQKSSISARKKTGFETSFEISTRADIQKLEELANGSNRSNLKSIRVNPTEDELLRDKSALQKIGQLTKGLDATIILEGAVLSHAYYQLMGTGAVVEAVHPFIGFEETREFNKLVRDKIPNVIHRHGEEVTIGKLTSKGLLVALSKKLIEEAHEVGDAENYDEMVEELADLSEVMNAILACLGLGERDLEEAREVKQRKRGGFKDGVVLLKTNKALPSESVTREGDLFEGIETDFTDSALSLNTKQFLELSEKVDRWTDTRRGLNWIEGIATIHVPISNDEWAAKTVSLEVPGTESKIVAEVDGRREKDRFHIELRVRISTEPAATVPPELFSLSRSPEDSRSERPLVKPTEEQKGDVDK